MAWTTPRTWTTGELVTASIMNLDHRDNLNFLFNGASARVNRSANKSIPSGTLTAIDFDQERFDTDTIHDNITNNTRLTAKTAGKYVIVGNVNWAVNASGNYRQTMILLDGASVIAVHSHDPNGVHASETSISTIWWMLVNQYVELLVQQDSGVAQTCSAEFSMARVSA